MRHDVFRESVTDYLEGGMPSLRRWRFEQHARRCTGCRRFLAQMRTTLRLLSRLAPVALDPHRRADVLEAYRDRFA